MRLLFASVACATLVLLASGCARGSSANAPGNRATIAVHFSRFDPDDVTARAGQPITITLHNDDPIEHEWMVGDAAMHERHRTGTEPRHDTIPTEVTIPALSSKETTVTFAEPGDYLYICHLPGHEKYGMVGTLHVVP